MSRPQFYTYSAFGEVLRQELWCSQAVRIGSRVEVTGQGGWDPVTGQIHPTATMQVLQAFINVELALKTAESKGWSQVIKVTIRITDELGKEWRKPISENLKKWMPDHQPVLSIYRVSQLVIPGTMIEIDVVAYDESEGSNWLPWSYLHRLF
ncbi:endoribonuclease L-psp family protein [Coprinopsis sp. MPI-PUGE-AT-0042]|nr:endoribonuclease L-psp family protein [Coprinopsis sp. MPI-PUGE-AT-0042]